MAAHKDKAPETEPVFEPGELIQAAALFETSPAIMAGALHGVTEPLTKAQAAEKLSSFLSRPVELRKRG